MIVRALPAQWLAREKCLHGQPAPLTTDFEIVAGGLHHLGRVGGGAAITRAGGQVGQYPAGNLEFPAFVRVFCVPRLNGYFLNRFTV